MGHPVIRPLSDRRTCGSRQRRGTRTLGTLALVALVALGTGCKPFGERVKVAGKGEIFYKPPVTREQALRLGAFLKSVDFFDGSRRKSVQLVKRGEVYQLRFVVIAGAVKNEPAIRALKIVGGMMAREVLGGAQVEVHLCDARFKTKRREVLPKGFGDFGERLTFGKGELFIRKPITAAAGKQVGERLVALKFFDRERRKSVQLTLVDGVYQLRLVATRAANAQHKQAFLSMALDLSLKVLGGAPVRTELCDDALEPFEKLPAVEAGTRLAYGKGELFYARGVDLARAQALGALLRKLGYFDDANVRAVQLRRRGAGYLVGFVVRPGTESLPTTQAFFRRLAAQLAPAFGAEPYQAQLVDGTFLTLVGL